MISFLILLNNNYAFTPFNLCDLFQGVYVLFKKTYTIKRDYFHRIDLVGVKQLGKKTYYVNIGTHEISQIPYGENAMYTIEADDMEIFQLRKKFNDIQDADAGTYIRSHVPFVPYHQDGENDAYDQGLQEVIDIIYELGTDKTKQDLQEIGLYKENK